MRADRWGRILGHLRIPMVMVSILGCEGRGEENPATPGASRSSRVEVVLEAVALPEQEVRPELSEVLILRAIDGLPRQFASVHQAQVSGSTAFVLAKGEEEIAVFSLEDGSRIKSIPFPTPDTRIAGIAPLTDGRLVAWDRNRKELWVLRPTGEFSGPVPLSVKGNPGYAIEPVDSTVWIWSTVSGDYRTTSLGTSVSKFSLDGNRLEVEILPPTIRQDPGFVLFDASGGITNFTREREVTWSPIHGLLLGENREYSFSIERGDTAFKVNLEYSPPVLTDAEAQWWGRKAAEFTAIHREITYSVPEVKPAYRSLSWDDLGRIWVWRYVRGQPTDSINAVFPAGSMPIQEPVVFDVFSNDGNYEWTLQLPPRSRILTTFGNRLLLATRVANLGNDEVVRLMEIIQPEE